MDLPELKQLVEQAFADGKLSPEEMDAIMEAIMADGQVDAEEMKIVDEIYKKIRYNQVELE